MASLTSASAISSKGEAKQSGNTLTPIEELVDGNPETILNAFNNLGKNGNKFVGLHSGAPDEMVSGKYGQPKFGQPYDPRRLNTFIATVPDKTIVFLFTPDGCVAKSTEENEVSYRKEFALENGYWMFRPGRIDETIFRRYGKLYMPGDDIYNQQLMFGDNENHEDEDFYDIWNIMGDDEEITIDDPVLFSARHGKKGKMMSRFKKSTYQDIHKKNLRRKNTQELKTITTQHLLNTYKGERGESWRILYIWSCSPNNSIKSIKKLLDEEDEDEDEEDEDEDEEDEEDDNQKEATAIFNELQSLRERFEIQGRSRFSELKNYMLEKIDPTVLFPSGMILPKLERTRSVGETERHGFEKDEDTNNPLANKGGAKKHKTHKTHKTHKAHKTHKTHKKHPKHKKHKKYPKHKKHKTHKKHKKHKTHKKHKKHKTHKKRK